MTACGCVRRTCNRNSLSHANMHAIRIQTVLLRLWNWMRFCIFQCLHISQHPPTPGYPLSPEHTYPRLPSSDPAGLPGTFPLLPIVSHSTAIEWEEEYDRGRAIKKGLGSDRVGKRWGESAPDKVDIESGLATLMCNSLLTCRPSARPYKIELPILSIHVILDG